MTARSGRPAPETLQQVAGQLTDVGGWAVEADSRAMYWSPEVARLLDADGAEEPPLEEALARCPAEHRQRVRSALESCISEGTSFDLEAELVTFAGRRITVRLIGRPEHDDSGRVTRVIGALRDITEERRAAERTDMVTRRLAETLESMGDGFLLLDRDLRVHFVNAAAEEYLRQPRHKLLGRVLWETLPEESSDKAHRAHERAVATGEPQTLVEFHYEQIDSWFDIEVYPSSDGFAVYFRDVTERVRDRQQLLEREAMLRRQAELLDEAQDAIVVLDLDGHITYFNRSAAQLYGVPREEAIGRDARPLLFDDHVQQAQAMETVLGQGSWTGEVQQRTDGGDPLRVVARWTLVRDRDGRPDGVFAINSDVTEQRRLEEQLLRAQRMESLGTLAGGMAHDLNNVLCPILLASELLQDEATEEEEARHLANTIHLSARQGADLVAQVLSFARGADGEREPVHIETVIHEVASIVGETFPKDIRLEVDADATAGTLFGDRTQLQQVLLNLAVNARDAMPDGGELTIRTRRCGPDAGGASGSRDGAANGAFAVIEVEDSGIGMAEQTIDRVFEPFFTTKPTGVGTGLGLSTSAAIVHAHGGSIEVESEPGVGTRFRVHLPLADVDAHRDDHGAAPVLPRGEGRLILVIDDDASVRAMTRQALARHGYRVVEAGDGAEGLSVFNDHQESVVAVLTDMMMPTMDGRTTIRALRSIDASLPIVATSGLHHDSMAAGASVAGGWEFLLKPYTSRELLEAIAEVLPTAPV